MAKQIRFTTPDIQTINTASIPQRSLIAQRLFEQGTSGAPVGHLTQGLNRLAKGLLGGYQLGQIRADEQKLAEQEKAAQAGASRNILEAFSQRQAPGPEFQGPTQPIPDDMRNFAPSDQQGMIERAGTRFQLPESPPVQRAPSPQEIAQVLLGNQRNQPLGVQMMMAQAQRELPPTAAEQAKLDLQRRGQNIDQRKIDVVESEGAKNRSLKLRLAAADKNIKKQQAEAKSDKELVENNFKNETVLRKEFTKESQDFKKQSDAITRVRKSLSGTGASDIALIFNYMKVLDPGSTVREGEAATVRNAASIPEIIRTWYNQAREGDQLGPEQRQDILRSSEELFAGAQQNHLKLVSQFTDLAERNKLNPQNILMDFSPVAGGGVEQDLSSMSDEELLKALQ